VNKDIKSKPGFCYEIFKNQAFWSTRNTIGYNPCSFYSGYIAKDTTPDQAWLGAEHLAIIDSVAQGELIPGCHNCYRAEQAGLVSRRMGSKEMYENYHKDTNINLTDTPIALDYSVGNLCNLKCTICGPENSSKWISDWAKLYPDTSTDNFLYRKNQYVTIDNLEHLKNIKSVHFHGGGDPVLSDAHVKLLQNIEASKGLSDVRVFYNINATNRVSDDVLDLWSRCGIVELYFSIDDVEDRFEYQRTGALWHDTVDTMQWYREHTPVNHLFYINCTWGYLNLYYLDELYRWHKENFAENRLGDPVKLIFQKCLGDYSLDWVSSKTMDVLENKFQKIPEIQNLLTMLDIQEKPHTKFWDIVRRTDNIRNLNFRKLCPEWSILL
jgi:hypothetical protein